MNNDLSFCARCFDQFVVAAIWPGNFAAIHPFSLHLEVLVADEVALAACLSDIHHTANTTRATVTIACKSDGTRNEFLCLFKRHVRVVVGINVTLNEYRARARELDITTLLVASLIDCIDLVAFVGIPTSDDQGSSKAASVGVDDLASDRCC